MTGDHATTTAMSFFVRSRNDALCEQVQRSLDVARTPYTVLIEGETGTGKELFARGIHAASGRSGPFVPLNCSAVPETMFEAELFGARRGAYTGLDSDRPGLFSIADGGTLFLDEIADLPAPMQAKLLRVLEDGVIRPLGATSTQHVDVRVVAATLKSLSGLVESGSFRRDLYFRLSPACIRLPALRERPEDIPVLIEDAIAEACALQGVSPRTTSPQALQHLLDYEWPGNIRELKNVIAAAVLASTSESITEADLPSRIRDGTSETRPAVRAPSSLPFFDALEGFERTYLVDLLDRAQGNISEAARLSGLSRASVRNKARRYGLLPGEPTRPHRSRVRLPS